MSFEVEAEALPGLGALHAAAVHVPEVQGRDAHDGAVARRVGGARGALRGGLQRHVARARAGAGASTAAAGAGGRRAVIAAADRGETEETCSDRGREEEGTTKHGATSLWRTEGFLNPPTKGRPRQGQSKNVDEDCPAFAHE